MKRSQVIAKLQTYKDLSDQSLIPEDVLTSTIEKALADGALKPLPISAFTEEAANLLGFAQKYGLVKSDASKSESNGEGREGASKYVAEKYPDFASAVAYIDALKGKVFEIEKDGAVSQVTFQPFWRTVKPKTATTEGETTV